MADGAGVGTLKSCVLGVVAATVGSTAGVVGVEPVLLALVVELSAVVVEVVVGVVVVVGEAIKLIDDCVDKAPTGIAALLPVAAAPLLANRPELPAVAFGLEPAVTL